MLRLSRSKQPGQPSAPRAVHQLVARLAWGDAVGNQARYLRELLRGWGYESEIYAQQWDERCAHEVRPAEALPREASADTGLLIHHSFESRLVPHITRAPGRKALLYHNITPAHFFAPYEQSTARGCRAGREELLALRPLVECAHAWSHYSAEELQAAGFPHVSVLPFALDWRGLDVEPDPTLLAELQDGCTNILFVGRAVPNKRVDQVLRVFTAYQQLYQPRSRLIIAGALRRESPYGTWLLNLKEYLGAERVLLLGQVSAAQLSACFRAASAYLSMSHHEGFGVPLLEAMYRGVPVVAYGASAVPETMGGAGLATLTEAPVEVARLLAVLERTPGLREQVLASQREHLATLQEQSTAERLRHLLTPFLSGQLAPLASPPAAATVDLVCPALTMRPDSPESRLCRHLARRLPGARLLALRPATAVRPAPLGPELIDGLHVWHFTPDQPVPRPDTCLPESASLQMAVRASSAAAVLLDVDTACAREVLPHVYQRAWGVRGTSRPPQADSSHTEWAQRLGARLLTLEPGQEEHLAERLAHALLASRGAHAS